MTDKIRSSKDRAPKDEAEWQYLWSGVDRAHEGWPIVKIQVAIFGNWKILALGVIAFIVMGGQELLQAWGLMQ